MYMFYNKDSSNTIPTVVIFLGFRVLYWIYNGVLMKETKFDFKKRETEVVHKIFQL